MISVKINFSGLSNIMKVVDSLKVGENKDKLLRTLATSLTPEVRNRIHVDGKNSDGENIGEYSNAYLKMREKKFKRIEGKKKVYSLTRQLENDLGTSEKDPIKTSEGYGIGVKNELSKNKIEWIDKDRKTFAASKSEIELARRIADEFTNNLF